MGQAWYFKQARICEAKVEKTELKVNQFINHLVTPQEKKKGGGGSKEQTVFFPSEPIKNAKFAVRDWKQSRYIIVHGEKQIPPLGAFPEPLFNWLQLPMASLKSHPFLHKDLEWNTGTCSCWESFNQNFISHSFQEMVLSPHSLPQQSNQKAQPSSRLTTANLR